MDQSLEIDIHEIAQLSEAEFDRLPYGAVRVDALGKVLAYNATEAEIARRDKQSVIGKNFFEDVAPCTNLRTFRGRLEALANRGGGTERFDYRFLFPWGERLVRIRMVVGAGARWIFVTPLD